VVVADVEAASRRELCRVGGREPAVPERQDHGGQHSRQESETKHRHQRAAEHVVRGLRGRLVAGRVVRLAARLLSAVLGAPRVVAVKARVPRVVTMVGARMPGVIAVVGARMPGVVAVVGARMPGVVAVVGARMPGVVAVVGARMPGVVAVVGAWVPGVVTVRARVPGVVAVVPRRMRLAAGLAARRLVLVVVAIDCVRRGAVRDGARHNGHGHRRDQKRGRYQAHRSWK